ncbi:MAG: hypothetical protein DMG57_26880 [Acidobacteria bacterium]|nr:MAG: hypothetical protein DMG57_26880 [Acidobacteriota bacterium]
MSARLDLFTVEQLARQHGIVVAYCRRCSNRKLFYATELSARSGPHKVLWNLRFRCSNCGHRLIDVHPYVPMNVR